jgi:hypothetical protein
MILYIALLLLVQLDSVKCSVCCAAAISSAAFAGNSELCGQVICQKYCRKREHITPTFRDVLHWLPVFWRIQFKVVLLTYKTLHGQSAVYTPSLCVTPASAAQTTLHLRSYQSRDAAVSRVNIVAAAARTTLRANNLSQQ